jgi:HEAT repeat protein
MSLRKFACYVVLVVMAFAVTLTCPTTRAQDDAPDIRAQSAQYARQLSSFDPLERQAGAEGLARLVAVDQRKLVVGYAREEKNKKVRLALYWALYRLGKSEALFEVVRDLDSARHDQAADYLTHLESPQPLYLFLPQDTTSSKVKARLLEVLGQIGDAETLTQIKPFTDSFDPKVSQAAQFASNQIQHRLDQPQTDVKVRPRVVGKPDPPK